VAVESSISADLDFSPTPKMFTISYAEKRWIRRFSFGRA
jgi:hypothetical protein